MYTILMIEDCVDLARERQKELEDCGYLVHWANNLQAAEIVYVSLCDQKAEGVVTLDGWIPPSRLRPQRLVETSSLLRQVCRDFERGLTLLAPIAASSMEQCREEQLKLGCDVAIKNVESYVDDILAYFKGYNDYVPEERLAVSA